MHLTRYAELSLSINKSISEGNTPGFMRNEHQKREV